MPTRTISRTVTNAYPAWRAAMTATDRLYYCSGNTPEGAPLLGTLPTYMGNGNESFLGAAWTVIQGYSSGTSLDDVDGPFGTMVYGTGGHGNISTQLLGVPLSGSSPAWGYYQQPYFQTSDTAGADIYYSPSEAAALIAGPRGNAALIRPGQEVADAATWDRLFPVAFNGWIIPRKMTTGTMGNSAPHGFRYANQCYLPASVTGTDPMLYVGLGPQGPFVQSYSPETVTDADWFVAGSLSSGVRRWPYYFKNLRTGAWTEHQWQPVGSSLNGFGGQRVGLFRDNKRMYVCAYIGGSPSYYYLDFSAGFAGHTVSTPVTGRMEFSKYSSGAFSDGDLAGRHFCVAPARLGSNTQSVICYDFDAGTSFAVDLAASGFSISAEDEWVGCSYDPINQRVLVVQRNPSTYLVEYWSITPATTLSNTAGWTCSAKRSLAFDQPEMSGLYVTGNTANGLPEFYGKVRFLPRLGVCLVPCNRQRMLAFRPAP